MDCRKAVRFIDKVVQGKLGMIGLHRLRKHVRQCASCQDEYRRADIRKFVIPGQPLSLSPGQEMPPILAVARTIVRVAIAEGASGIVIEPTESGASVHYDVNGSLQEEVYSLPHFAGTLLLECFLILAGMDLDQRNVSQRGEILVRTEDEQDHRILLSTEAVEHGQRITLRV